MITVKEAKEIMHNESSVTYGGSEYRKISALIFRKADGSFRASAELLDKNRNSVVVVGLDRLHPGDMGEPDPIDEVIRERITEVEAAFGLFVENTLKGNYKTGQEHLHETLGVLLKIDDRIVRFNNNWTDTSTLGGVKEESTAEETEHQKRGTSLMDMNRESRKTYLQMAIIGYKHTFKKLMQLIKLKAKGVFLQIQYRTLEISYKRESRKSITKKRDWRKTIIKYLYITIIGIVLFLFATMQLEKTRGYRAIGGEGILLFLPLICFLSAGLQGEDDK